MKPSSRSTAGAVLRMRGITKRFAGVTALDGVDLELQAGEVHALVGENGAGKSTLIKIMTGAYSLEPGADGGTLQLDGREVRFRSPREAQEAGVVAVYQEVNLLGYLSVAENLLSGREPRRFGLIDWARLHREADAALRRLGLELDVAAPLGSLPVAERQLVAIARAVTLGARVLVLDEPTSSLAAREVALLHDVVRRLKAEGVALVYISHRFDELYAVCDRVTVLRDGRKVATHRMSELPRLDLVCLMLGKSREALGEGATGLRRHPAEGAAPLLVARGLRRGARLVDVSLAVARGEIVGLAGLLGSGRSETARAIFGADRREGGEVEIGGAPRAQREPGDGIAAGLGYLAEDRKAEGIIPDLSVRENLTLAALPALSRFGIVSRARQDEIVERFVRRFRIKCASPDQKIRELSGGNQQKVLLARWLCRDPELMILDEPTRGVDLGAKAEIQAVVNELADAGVGVLLISSELEELLEGCSRVVVLRDGRDVAALAGDELTEAAIVRAMASGGQGEPAAAGKEAP